MLEDDGKPIYFDKEYDATNYEIIEEKYKTQRDNLSSEEFIIFLTDEFINKHKMDEKPAEHMATTLAFFLISEYGHQNIFVDNIGERVLLMTAISSILYNQQALSLT